MNIVFNKCIFAYLCIFIVQQSISMNFRGFLLIFALPIFLSKYPPIFSNISDISVKSKYRYIRNYQYFFPWASYYNYISHYIFFIEMMSFFAFFLHVKEKCWFCTLLLDLSILNLS